MIDKIVSKLTSGKFLLTIITGVIFAYCSIKGVLNAEAISAICGMVFISYFQKKDENGGLK